MVVRKYYGQLFSNFFATGSVLDTTQPNPSDILKSWTQPNPRMDPTHVHLWVLIAGCAPRWSEFSDQNSIHGDRKNMSTVAECQKFCISEADCIAVDFNLDDQSCWIHYGKEHLDKHTYNLDNTNQYRLNRTCQHVTRG